MSRADSYRQKVYDAEVDWRTTNLSTADGKALQVTLAEAQVIVDSLCESFDIKPVLIRQNARLQQWAGWYLRWDSKTGGSVIEVRRSTFSYKTMLHEFAHHLDACRQDYDGKGHGGSFTQAMLDVVGRHLNEDAMLSLMRCYENQGAIIGAEETRKVVARSKSGVNRRQERHGLIEEAWAVRLTNERYGSMWVEQDKLSIDNYLSRAGVWKRRSTAEKVAEEMEVFNWEAEVVKVKAELDTLYSNRWWAKEVI